jgi:magnesium transporter
VDGFQQILRDMLTVNATLVAQRQNDEMRALTEASNDQNVEVKKISAYAAILFAPTLIGTIYGMNFKYMPELEHPWGYPLAILLMGAVCGALYWAFKRQNWL